MLHLEILLDLLDLALDALDLLRIDRSHKCCHLRSKRLRCNRWLRSMKWLRQRIDAGKCNTNVHIDNAVCIDDHVLYTNVECFANVGDMHYEHRERVASHVHADGR